MTMPIRNYFEEALAQLRPTDLNGVDSPYLTAALYCRRKRKFNEARNLLKHIPEGHWQYKGAMSLKDELYEQELAEYRSEVLGLRLKVLNQAEAVTVMSKPEARDSFKALIDKLTPEGDKPKPTSIFNEPSTLLFSSPSQQNTNQPPEKKTTQKPKDANTEKSMKILH